MKLFTQPCLIKKNTAKIRERLEELGYTRANMVSGDPNYDNDKEPWIFTAYDIYVCLDKEYYKEMISIINTNEYFQVIPEISKNILECGKNESKFFENASKYNEIDMQSILKKDLE